jgi:hypothetical protein
MGPVTQGPNPLLEDLRLYYLRPGQIVLGIGTSHSPAISID